MSNIRKTLKSSAGGIELLYNSESGEETLSIAIANNGSDTYFWVYIVPSGGTSGTTNMLIPGRLIKATETYVIPGGITPLIGDSIYVRSTSGDCIFHLFGDLP